MAFGWLLGALIVPPTKVVRPDGSRPQAREKSSLGFSASLHYLYRILNWKIIALIPMLYVALFIFETSPRSLLQLQLLC